MDRFLGSGDVSLPEGSKDSLAGHIEEEPSRCQSNFLERSGSPEEIELEASKIQECRQKISALRKKLSTISVDVRIIAATNKDLKLEIQEGNFREDLFYRLNVIPFVVPPLRERKEDIPLLACHFLKEFCVIHGRAQRDLSPEALHVLRDYPWPGNIRELKNLMERMIILTAEAEEGQAISAANVLRHLQEEGLIKGAPETANSAFSAGKNLRDARQEFEKEFILRTLKDNDWNISKTAQILGIERSHLHRKIKSYGIEA